MLTVLEIKSALTTLDALYSELGGDDNLEKDDDEIEGERAPMWKLMLAVDAFRMELYSRPEYQLEKSESWEYLSWIKVN